MKTRLWITIFMFIPVILLFGQSSRTEITAEYGPPSAADTWEQFVIPLTAETFNVDEATFEEVMSNITSFWIKTEMHYGNDVGGIDDVSVGSVYSSYFHTSSEGWSSGGDGTMEWMQSGGYDGGFLQISDWATGDWHWLIAPDSWSGDWSSLIGQNIEFWFKTDQPSISAQIKLTSETVERLVISTPANSNIPPNDSVLIDVEIIPPSEEDITINFSSSNSSCITVPESLTVPASEQYVQVYFHAAESATNQCESIIEATSPGYITSRITMKVDDAAGILDFNTSFPMDIYPNPGKGKFIISVKNSNRIERCILYNLLGNKVKDIVSNNTRETVIDATAVESGIYLLNVFTTEGMKTSKLVIE